MNQATMQKRMLPQYRNPRKLECYGAPTVLIPGDRLLIDLELGRLSFLRGIVSMYVSNGARRDSVFVLTYQPNRILATEIAEFCARLMSMEIKQIECAKPNHLLFEFTGEGKPLELGIGDRLTVFINKGELAILRGKEMFYSQTFTSIQNAVAGVELAEISASLMGLGITAHSRSESQITFEYN